MLIINIIFFTFVVFSLLGICHLFINLKLKDVSKFVLGLTLFFGLSFFIFLIVQYINLVGNPFIFEGKTDSQTDNIRSGLGALGDYFGGLLNPILAFLSFIALLYTLNLNQKELAETRKELARAAQAHEDSKKVMEEQLKTQALQQFENNFYQLFTQLNKLQDDLVEQEGKHLTAILNEKNVNISEAKTLLLQDRKISRYFILLYQIMKLIDQELRKIPSQYERNTEKWKAELKEKKKFYTNLLRSVQDNRMLQLLFINCYDDQFLQYKDYLQEASFFEHMSLTSDMGYNYLILCALPYYVKNKQDFKKSKEIPFFDEGLGLKDLTCRDELYYSCLLDFIYEVHRIKLNKFLFDFQFVQYVFEKSCESRNSKKMFALNSCLDKVIFLTSYLIQLKIIDEYKKNIDIKLKIVKINFFKNDIQLICSDNEKVTFQLDAQKIQLQNMKNGKESQFDDTYGFKLC